MPNYIKNRIELIGSADDVNNFIDKFSTSFERKPSVAHDGELIYQHRTSKQVGWLNKETNEFRIRNKDGFDLFPEIPECFEQEFEEAWTRFPDFDKIIPMPESLSISSGSLGYMAHELLFGTSSSRSFSLGMTENQKRFKALSIELQREAVDLAIKYHDNIEKYGFATWYDWSIANWGTKWNSSNCEKFSDNAYDFVTAWSGVPNLIELMSKECPSVKIIYKYSDEDTGSNCGIGEYQGGEIYFRELENGSNSAYEMAFELRPDRKENYKLVGDKYAYIEED